MNIYANKGDKVVFSNPENGHEHQQREVCKHLKPGEVYTIARTHVHSWKTDVYLEEVPDIPFNSVFFEDKEDAPKNPPPTGDWRITRVENFYTRSGSRSVSGQPESAEHPNIKLGTVYEGAIDTFGKGELPDVGQPLIMWVSAVNGRRAKMDESFFRSSPVVKIENHFFHTKNSIYKVEKL